MGNGPNGISSVRHSKQVDDDVVGGLGGRDILLPQFGIIGARSDDNLLDGGDEDEEELEEDN